MYELIAFSVTYDFSGSPDFVKLWVKQTFERWGSDLSSGVPDFVQHKARDLGQRFGVAT